MEDGVPNIVDVYKEAAKLGLSRGRTLQTAI